MLRRDDGKLADYSLLGLLLLPNLLWILLDRSVWVSDASWYGIGAVRLHDALGTSLATWWSGMLAVGPKPPVLPWLGQFFVPIGARLGNIDGGLLLVPFLAQCATLVLLYRAARELLGTRSMALLSCLIVGSAPVFIDVSKQYYVQSVQFAIVVWVVYIMTRASIWDPLVTVLQLLAAGSLAMLTMMSTPLFCIVPGAVAILRAFRKWPPRVQLGRLQLVTMLVSLSLLAAALFWYSRHMADAIEYARFSFNYRHGGLVEGGYVLKLAVWLFLLLKGAMLLPTALLISLVAVILITRPDRGGRRWDSGILAVALQLPLVLAVLAGSEFQESRYVVPLLGFLALTVCWALSARGRRWVAPAVAAAFLLQWTAVNLDAFGAMHVPGVHARRLTWKPDRRLALLERIARLEKGGADRVLLSLGGLDLYNLQVEYHVAKDPGSFASRRASYDCVEFLLTRTEVDGDADRAWRAILSWRPDYIVLQNEELRRAKRTQFGDPAYGWRNVMLGAIAISDRVAADQRYELIPDPHYPELAIYHWAGNGS